MLEQIWDLTLTYYLMSVNLGEGSYKPLGDDIADHTEILQALEARDGKKARQAMVRHIEKNLEFSILRIKEIEKTS